MQQTKIWDYFQNNPDVGNLAFNAELRYQYLADRIQNGMNVLDIGVGRGGLERLLVSKGVNVYCLDPNKESIDYLRAEFDLGDRARVGFSQEIPFENERFDVVIMSEVLEHLSDKKFEKTLEEVCRVLRPGGKFIGTVPATEDLLVSRVVCPDCAKVFHRWGHVQSFSQELLKARFASFFSGERGHPCHWEQ